MILARNAGKTLLACVDVFMNENLDFAEFGGSTYTNPGEEHLSGGAPLGHEVRQVRDSVLTGSRPAM